MTTRDVILDTIRDHQARGLVLGSHALAAKVGIGVSGLRYHLNRLKRDGLITVTRTGIGLADGQPLAVVLAAVTNDKTPGTYTPPLTLEAAQQDARHFERASMIHLATIEALTQHIARLDRLTAAQKGEIEQLNQDIEALQDDFEREILFWKGRARWWSHIAMQNRGIVNRLTTMPTLFNFSPFAVGGQKHDQGLLA